MESAGLWISAFCFPNFSFSPVLLSAWHFVYFVVSTAVFGLNELES